MQTPFFFSLCVCVCVVVLHFVCSHRSRVRRVSFEFEFTAHSTINFYQLKHNERKVGWLRNQRRQRHNASIIASFYIDAISRINQLSIYENRTICIVTELLLVAFFSPTLVCVYRHKV